MDEQAIRRTQGELRKHPIVQETLELLARDLPDSLLYHALSHTEDVLDEALRFGSIDRLNPRELELLAIAAACHDVGFISTTSSNEPLGAAFARERMEGTGGYSTEEIELVERMILDTALIITEDAPRQSPSTKLSGYLLDADLSNLGRDDFFEKCELLRNELGEDNDLFGKKTLALLTAHQWHTAAARALRQERKELNIRTLQSMIRSK
jgi:predicted metal-dependent HD superfamily phosphohydrolase